MREYGREPEDYMKILEKQGYACRLCGTIPSSHYALRIDHNHATKKIRGLLCGHCNTSLGWFENRKLEVINYSDIEEVDI